MKAHLLYVEDDESLAFVTRDNLELEGFTVTHCADGQSALKIVQKQRFDLCILDVMLPGADGFTIAEEIRKSDHQTPIIFLTAKSLKEDKIHGLKLGADDYIVKPFSIEELLLKVDIFLRRRQVAGPSPLKQFSFGSFEFDYENITLRYDGNDKILTQREADLLKLFLDHRNQVLKRSFILKELWGEDDYFLGRSLDVFVSRLRKYLRFDENIKIENIHSVGFRFKCSTSLR